MIKNVFSVFNLVILPIFFLSVYFSLFSLFLSATLFFFCFYFSFVFFCFFPTPHVFSQLLSFFFLFTLFHWFFFSTIGSELSFWAFMFLYPDCMLLSIIKRKFLIIPRAVQRFELFLHIVYVASQCFDQFILQPPSGV